ncbi:MAG: tRNA uridine-5-carboxymethylaminomethyl(34) synthesis enzyme MnmG [Schleiferiaceae bacterium]|jgi:tRNA uridine 5-carboxymethylaminomethyl modification enzyme|nr:tRNA uridine-5-carboxymethylaminomethyl(34) synthesis enzyme MnmG [Schleiferiaceae bacterium]MDP4627833.1 tRNA uridine-5-carboxymethylaminomethyl(34) synthesis enzyme MnmG [Schleiferiaceae bacterium]MDP4728059.1 tRNA uridine-5-carboxymethylaminomethyl(34) synthesis enzyme MnmG [Schleiferiaceae bacterium]MDP4859879.1 tRNA uridine-5-carboxymethylaminomethyl(34) synthesis enzyme MnmG [Schleiferiaceae bacterium]MDP4900274.1 tRNA uridine-5-carboxymethylaminomethyl(34) synthesis enzyme MnmG [Schle
MLDSRPYDVIVVGAGHAGSEAAAAAARLGSRTLLVTMNLQTIGQMSCNPAMGGVAKGQIVREIDALGGLSGIVTDKTAVQFRMLNRSKGPAMWSPRAQSDRWRFAEEWRLQLEAMTNLDFLQDMAVDLLVQEDRVVGIKTSMGQTVYGSAVVLTNGTFLNGVLHIGERQMGGGRAGEKAATGITERLVELGFESGRMKTGTPPRIDGRSLDYSKFEVQHGDENPSKFSYSETTQPLTKQRPCHIAYTSDYVHDLLREGFDRSPMFNGSIQGTGPRYCPSIEDKINRFADKDRHQLFVEPEGWNTVEVYVNGFSTSLPEEVQVKALRAIPGFEQAKFFRPGYAIEYDYFPPTQLGLSLETKLVENLFFAGQINGTTGYEEAAAQGLMAGINAHRKVHGAKPVVLDRSDAYIGVLIDDLVTKGTEEPYRMFTSRAEYRLLLRQDNADLRLTPKGRDWGMVDDVRWARMQEKVARAASIRSVLDAAPALPAEVNALLESKGTSTIATKGRMAQLLTRPQLELADLLPFLELSDEDLADHEALLHAEIEIKYAGYIAKEMEHVGKLSRLEETPLPANLDYASFKALSMEARQKLAAVRPSTIGQASRVSGVSPADVSVLLVHLGR